MTLKGTAFEKYKTITYCCPFFCFFDGLLSVLINERSHAKFLAFTEGSIEPILRGEIWCYGFDNVLLQI